MASLLPRAALLPRSITSSAAASPRTTTALTRFFSSTPSAPAQQIPPESPLFINVPNPPQDQSIEAKRELKRVRGFVPVPRRVFAHRDSHEKPTDSWLTRAAPEPSNAKSQAEPGSDVQAWKRKMAVSRRENIRSGVRDLWARKQRIDAKRLAARTAKLAANKAAAMAPEREDERLTRGTINAGTLQTSVALDPQRFERCLASAARTAAIAADKSEARRDAIQTLYMNARSFIVNETELEVAVNREFADDHFDRMGQSGAGYRIQNIWDAQNEPVSVDAMLKDLQRDNYSLVSDFTSDEVRTVRRQKQVAEELTGGKMDE
ncbi:hypothetical protein FHL15_004089 [Xylaria flabelliformis]|uniref:Uncharacterized protein n=1 Tax=Xylaria flabelliformis TaxID=2512241 RepID=A0A553I480_9PEZI|nr:hypothetical protein FHL15_004089 [Xylaria flabelliformis]